MLANSIVEKITKLIDVEKEDELRININLISKSIAFVEVSHNTFGGAHPDFGQNWFYIDLSAQKELKADFFFLKPKIQ